MSVRVQLKDEVAAVPAGLGARVRARRGRSSASRVSKKSTATTTATATATANASAAGGEGARAAASEDTTGRAAVRAEQQHRHPARYPQHGARRDLRVRLLQDRREEQRPGDARKMRGRCVGDAWEMRGRCVGGAWEVHGECMGLCMMDSSSCRGYTYYGALVLTMALLVLTMAHMTERVSMPELSAQAVLLKVCCW